MPSDSHLLLHHIMTLTHLCQDIKNDPENLRETMIQKIDTIKMDISREIDEKLHLLREDISQDISRITTRVERLKTQVDTILDEDNFNPSRTIIVQSLSDEPSITPHNLAQALVRDGLGLPTEVVRAK